MAGDDEKQRPCTGSETVDCSYPGTGFFIQIFDKVGQRPPGQFKVLQKIRKRDAVEVGSVDITVLIKTRQFLVFIPGDA